MYVHGFLKKHIKYTVISFYVAITPILIVGIAMGTFMDPTNNAITIIIMLCTLFMFITDKPDHIIGWMLGVSTVFLICSYYAKTPKIFVGDVINLCIYLSIGISVNILMLRDRVESAENYVNTLKQAEHDTLTSILNRGAGDRIVSEYLERGEKGAFIMVDIDDFKHINDTYGHQIGDEVIRVVSHRLKNIFNGEDTVWRLGGDEFAVFAIGLTDKTVCERRLSEVLAGLSGIKTSHQSLFDIKISIGCSICLSKNCDFDSVYKSSDNALYEAKNKGKKPVHYH